MAKSLLEEAGKTRKFDVEKIINRVLTVGSIAANVESEYISSKIAVAFEDIIINCTFRGKTCSKTDFQLFVHPLLLHCYTFIGGRNTEKLGSYGPHSGLSLIMKGQEGRIFPIYDKYSNTGNVQSIVVSIDEPRAPPKLIDGSRQLMPGTSTSFALSQRTFHRLDDPYSKCAKWKEINLSGNEYVSTQSSCYQRCWFEFIRKTCGCFTTVTDIKADLETIHHCEKSNLANITDTMEKILCEQRARDNLVALQSDSKECDCPWNCDAVESIECS